MSEKNNLKTKKISFKVGIFILSLLVVFPTCAIINLHCSIPDEITISSGSDFSYTPFPFTSVSRKNTFKEAANNSSNPFYTNGNGIALNTSNIGSYYVSVNLFDKIPIKNVAVNITPKKYVLPSGAPIGVKLYTDGVLIVGMSYVTTPDGETVYPAKSAGLKSGDVIIGINGNKITSIDDMTSQINKTDGTFTLTVQHNGKTLQKEITAAKSNEDNGYKMGVWVRDTAAGVGTLTFYDPETNKYASLGHAITDVDTGSILNVSTGKITVCNIVSVTKGTRGNPGELIGSFTGSNIGTIDLNSAFGVYGTAENPENIKCGDMVEVASKFQITEGEAYILSDVDGNGIRKYTVSIQKVSKDGSNNKGIVFKVTDPELIEKTGGIVQGMSGSPIIQNDMLVGAVTHVFVNDPTKGYGIFAENMIDKINSIS